MRQLVSGRRFSTKNQAAKEGIKKAGDKEAEEKLKEKEWKVRKHCPICGHPNTRELKYCAKCGAKLFETGIVEAEIILEEMAEKKESIKEAEKKLQVKKYCPICGLQNERGLKYCTRCGAKL